MKKILAIDDQQDNLTTLKAVIKNQIPDCIVFTALSGAEGIDIAQKEQPDTILLDIIMPKMDGYEVCKLLKDNESTKHIPIIMITAIKTDIESRVKGLNLGADAFLSKPIDHIELSAQINVMLRIKEAEDRLRTDKKGLKEIVREQSLSLRESEEKYKALYENAPLPYQSLNEDGEIIDVNPEWLRLLGYERDEVIGTWYGSFLHPDSSTIFKKNFPVLKKCGAVHDVPFKIKTKDGRFIDIFLNGLSSYNPDGSFKQTYCVFQDITERKLAEKRLDEVSKNWQITFDAIDDFIIILSPNHEIIEINKAGLASLNKTREEIIGNKCFQVVHNTNTPISGCPCDTSLSEKRKVVTEYTQDNRIYELIAWPVFDENNTVKSFTHIVKDITERKLAAIALEESELKYRSLIENTNDVVFCVDEKGEYKFTNQVFAKTFGKTPDYFVGKNFWDIYPKEEADHRFAAVKEMFRTGEVQTIEVSVPLPDRTLYFLAKANPIKDETGKVILNLTTAIDITDRKQAEVELIAAKEKAERNEIELIKAQEIAHLGSWYLDVETNEVVWTEELYKMYGFDPTLPPPPYTEHMKLFTPESWEILSTSLAKTRETGIPYELELKTLRKDKSKGWMWVRGEAILDEGNKIIGLWGAAQDITVRKQAELELVESEERFKSLHNASFGGIAIHDKGIILECNQGLSEMTGYSLDELIGMDGLLLIATEHREMVMNKIVTGYEKPYEANGLRKNGEPFPMQLEARNVPYKGKNVRTVEFRDVTERKQAEEVLKQREALLKAIFESTGDGLLVVDINGLVTYKNDEFLKMWKIPSDLRKTEFDEKLLEAVIDQLVHPKQFLKKVKELYNSNKSGLDILDFKDGRIFERKSQPLIIENKIAGRVWSFSDITERKLAEKALFESEYRFSKLIQQSPFIIEIYDSQGLQVSVNTAYENLWGFPASQTVNKFNVLRSKEVVKTGLIKFVNQAYKGKVVSVPEYKFDPTGETEAQGLGRVRWLSTKIFPLKDPLGKVSNIVIMHEDVTDRKRSDQIQKVLYNISDTVTSSNNIEELIAKIKDHLSGIIDTTNFYIGLYDEQTKMISLPFVADEKDEIESFPAENSLTGHVIKTQKSLLVTADQQEEMVKNGIIKFLGSRSQVWLGVPLIINGVVIGALAVQSYTDKNAYSESDREILEFVSDQISLSIERKQTEQKLIKALEKAKESDRLKSAFLATMSHELRTPLNAIIGFSDIIKEDLPIAEIMEFNQTINSSGNHLLTIVEDLFDITLIETGELKIINEAVKIDSLLNEVKEVIKIEQLNLNKAHLELNLIIPESEKQLRVNTDPWRLKQIFINLLKNALKFTHKGSVKFGFTLNMVSEPAELKFFVRDTGIGIPKDKQEFIFDVFRQIEDSHTRTYGGTGIGLSISRRLTELLGGRMWVDSDTNGSSFYFTIPLEMIVDQDEPDIKAELSSTSIKDITILVVEDDESSFEYLKVILKKTAQFILWASNGEEAVDLCKNNPDIDLVLMDINMPVMNGYDATKAIKEFRPNLPIVAQTAYAIAGDREKSLAAGCDDYISKPIKRKELMDKIKKLLSC